MIHRHNVSSRRNDGTEMDQNLKFSRSPLAPAPPPGSAGSKLRLRPVTRVELTSAVEVTLRGIGIAELFKRCAQEKVRQALLTVQIA